jgi:His/Glu/Gln/Arg/opine family amino acid ABC transporter permease subunit
MEGLRPIQQTFFDLHEMAAVVPTMLEVGLPNTLLLSVLASLIGIAIGLPLSLGLAGKRRRWRLPARAYVDVLRGLPHILTVYLIGQGLPLAGLALFGNDTYAYAALAIGMIESAYMAEIFRAGIQSVPQGQREAAQALGLGRWATMRLVVLPQALRRVLPPLTGQFILVIKGTALVFLLGLTVKQRELFSIAQDAAVNDANLSPLTVAGIAYLLLTVPLTYAVNAWERHLRRSS